MLGGTEVDYEGGGGSKGMLGGTEVDYEGGGE